MVQYPWAGNVRELENYIERFALMAEQEHFIPLLTLPRSTESAVREVSLESAVREVSLVDAPARAAIGQDVSQHVFASADLPIKAVQDAYFEYVYVNKNGVIGGKQGVAATLKISEHTAYTWVRKLGLSVRRSGAAPSWTQNWQANGASACSGSGLCRERKRYLVCRCCSCFTSFGSAHKER